MASSKDSNIYAVWNRLDNCDDGMQNKHSGNKNKVEVFYKARRDEQISNPRSGRSSNPPKRRDTTPNQGRRGENPKSSDFFQTLNSSEQRNEFHPNRIEHGNNKNNTSNKSIRNNNMKKTTSFQNLNQLTHVEDSRMQLNQQVRSQSSNRRVKSRNMKQPSSIQNLDGACLLEYSGRFVNQHAGRDFPNEHVDILKDKNGRRNYACSDQASSKPKVIKPMYFNKLKSLSEKDPNEVLLTINDKENGFILLLNQDVSRDLMAYILIVLGKAVSLSSNMNNIVCKVLTTVTSNRNFFLLKVQQYLASFQMQKPDEFHLDSLVSLTGFLQKFQVSLPSNAAEILPILLPLLKTTCERFLSGDRASVATSKLQEIEEQNDYVLKKYTTAKEIKKTSQDERWHFMEPPENYRSIPVMPNVSDIHQACSFLRPNVVEGRYQNTEHYLDVQYRLLREDYVRPLRDGIAEYLRLKKQNKSVKKCKDVKVYPDMQILKQEFVNGGLVHMAYFNDQSFAKIKWDFSKRFLTGALLCLSSDDFETMHFATVACRDSKELSRGLLYIRFEELTDFVLNLNPLIHFVVIETSAYFEAYRYNLNALLQLNENTLPLKRYIIETQKTVQKPEYMSETVTYDMRPLLLPLDDIGKSDGKGNFVGDFKCPISVAERVKNIPVLEENRWPTSSELNLDPSQYAALKAAVTKEFAIIQGPPGTGKTYVGLRIAQLLLHNESKWQLETNPSPILVICYTNHALDQFLEGLLLFTQRIVRVGGRGKNEAISHYQLSNLKNVIKAKREVPHYIFSNIRQKNYELHRLKEEIDRVRKRVNISGLSVLGEKDLIDHIYPFHYDSLKSIGSLFNLKDDGRFVEDWLGTRVSNQNQFGNSFEIVEKKDSNSAAPTKSDSNAAGHTFLGDGDDAGSEGEADIEYIEAQRDINSEEFAGVSYEIPKFDDEDEEVEIVPVSADGWRIQGGRKKLKKYIRQSINNSKAMSDNEEKKVKNVWMLHIKHRWRLYKLWLERFIKKKEREGLKMQEMLRSEYNELCEMRAQEDIYICKQALVVGMTTTGAAKYRHIVENVKPRIIIVEEAAEILESHIVTSLTRDTQHVILIGDHQQLRPNPTVHLLATQFKLNVSLFERMVQNGLDCYRLDMQHRMRPEIASLLVPHIYTNLQNHESVNNYENIKGVSKNVFFITHEFNELQEDDSKSKVNEHEAKFIIKLCKYFILQGYKPSQITVLTTYSGQLFELKRQNDKNGLLKEVKFTVVDNFQGEENDIILISFVRSNVEGQIGFLKVANRVCVALSRAKKGLFCIGNFHLLAEKSDLWKNIVETLKQNDAIGPSLQLMCQNHPGVSNVVQNDQDFDSVPEGGCSRKCEYRLSCGHVCSLMCHPYDPQHQEIRCLKPCAKKCDYGHPCTKKCYKDCAPCETLVPKTIEECGHVVQVFCDLRDTEITCNRLCDKYLPCGHMCSNRCSEFCVLKCMENIKITSIVCNHKIVIQCSDYDNVDLLMKKCKEPCRTELFCGHMCRGTCGKCRQGRLHIACMQPCKRILVCGHECKSPCSESCPPCKEPCANECSHSKCPKTCGEPCEKCTEPCSWECEHKKCNQICGDPCDRTGCDEPCSKVLKCEHPCIGVCGEPCPNDCRECNEEVKDIFFGSEDEPEARFVSLEDCKHVFELQGITHWLVTDIQNAKEIQMKACPKCKTAIRKSLRFGNVVKSCLADIEKVKKITYGDKEHNIQKQNTLFERIEHSDKLQKLDLIHRLLLKLLTSGRIRSIQELTSIENVINLSLSLVDATQPIHGSYSMEDASFQNLVLRLQTFMESNKQWLICFIQNEISTASEQQLKELSWEIHRLKLAGNLLGMIKKVTSLNAEAKMYLDKLLSIIITYSPFGETNMKNFTSKLQTFSELIGRAKINVSEMEKQSILKAMGLSKGHWYQCPNGHVYCITECGGANQESVCNECGEKIGGRDHRLIASNRVATDMDGAAHSAWSDAMNMLNYRF